MDFDAKREPQNLQHIWVILPRLPMMFWQEQVLKAIGDKLGNFISMEENWDTKVDRRCAKILVELDLRDGLYEEIKLEMHGSIWNQKLDYWKIPFRCFACK